MIAHIIHDAYLMRSHKNHHPSIQQLKLEIECKPTTRHKKVCTVSVEKEISRRRISGPRGGGWGAHTYTPRDTGTGVHAHDVSRMAVAARSILCHPKRLRRPRSWVIRLSEKRHGQRTATFHTATAGAGQTRTSPSGRANSNTWLQTCSSFDFAAEFRHLSRPQLKSVSAARERATELQLYGEVLTLLMNFVLSGKGVSEEEQGRPRDEISDDFHALMADLDQIRRPITFAPVS